jgi:hypothetical protein
MKSNNNKSGVLLRYLLIVPYLITILLLFSGCCYYKVVSRENNDSTAFIKEVADDIYEKVKNPVKKYSSGDLVKVFQEDRLIYIMDTTSRWFLPDPEISEDTIFSSINDNPLHLAILNKGYRFKCKNKCDVLKVVVLYVDMVSFDERQQVSIPIASIKRCDIYEMNSGKRAAAAVFAALGLGIVAAGITVTIIALSSWVWLLII